MCIRPSLVRRGGAASAILAGSVMFISHWAGITSPFGVLVLGGALFRSLSLIPTIYGDQCVARMALAMPELQKAHRDFLYISQHPNAVIWEKKVAAQKLKNDRNRFFRSHRTNNIKMFVPHAMAALLSLYALCIPSHILFDRVTQGASAHIINPLSQVVLSTRAAPVVSLEWMPTASAVAASIPTDAMVCVIDPTLTIASVLTLYNVVQHLHRRLGFNDRMDSWALRIRRRVCLGYGTLAAGSLLYGPAASLWSDGGITAILAPLPLIPPYLAPVWLGMSLITFAKTLLINKTPPGRALCRIAEYPPQHGSYGAVDTAEGHEYRIDFTSVDMEDQRARWKAQKRMLEYEFDIRLHRYLTKTGLFTELDEMEFEAERLKQMRAVARERNRGLWPNEEAAAETKPHASTVSERTDHL
ncbi:unnamed protein product [Phytomonas sp. EM1]|nr:unnamed protein product [Phytomonas sp. EM1]|eukprot:CCW63937.1 unnamed protein product [Phytomonas sp. isolate EM1]